MRRHSLGKELSRQWELERKDAKRAEARLKLGLLKLEESRLYRMNTVAREQRLIQKELEKLKQDNSKKKFSSFGNALLGTQKKPEIAISQKGGQRHKTAESDDIRTKEIHLLQTKECETSKPKEMANSQPTDYRKNKNEVFSQSPRPSISLESRPKATQKGSVAALNPPQERDSIKQTQGISTDLQNHRALSKSEQGLAAPIENEVIEVMQVIPDEGISSKPPNTGKENYTPSGEITTFNPNTYTFYSYLRTVDTMPTYLELFAKVKNARYLRHRVPPEFEREISIGEVFGHQTCLRPKEGNESDERLSI